MAMLTRYKLHIDDEDYTLREDDLQNWEAVKCSRTRSDYGGVVRSFTSQFEFVNEARRRLMALYLRDGFNAEATVTVETQTNNWTYEKRFECQLDFSSIKWEDCVLKINALDGSIASLIKAGKSTKYEYVVGEDIIPDRVVRYDRIPMVEYAKYEFTQGTTYDDNADIKVRFSRDQQPWVGGVGSEVAINLTVYYSEDQKDNSNGFLLRAEKDVEITFDYDLDWRNDTQPGGSTMLGLRIKRGGSFIPLSDTQSGNFCEVKNRKLIQLASVSSVSDLPSPDDIAQEDRPYTWACIGGLVYALEYNHGTVWQWTATGKTPEEYFRESKTGTMTFQMQEGDLLVMTHSLGEPNANGYLDVRFVRSLFTFRWKGIGEAIDIEAFTPEVALNALLRSMTGRSDIRGAISSHDPRIAGTYLMAAESIRGLESARLYSSFNEFCDWMSAVFGYTYIIGNQKEALGFSDVVECGHYTSVQYSYVSSHIGRSVTTDDIWYFMPISRFLARNEDNGKFYTLWPGHEDYNNSDGYARTDVLFRFKDYYPDRLCRFDTFAGTALYPILTEYTEDDLDKEFHVVRFLHRSELFDVNASIHRIVNPTDVKYSVNSGSIYTSVTAGYDRKEYNSVNGRDEFNFSNTYTTGCKVGDRTLTLVSKYRADSYGIEFAAQYRSKDTTDTKSDKDVFFMLCRRLNGQLLPDRTLQIENSVIGRLFNGAFSPMACVMANSGLIGLQASEMTLSFASSTANSDIVINDVAMSSDLTLETPLATSGVIEFSTYEDITDAMEDRIIQLTSCGITYRGFLMSADTCYARKESTACKLIVKEVMP